MEEASKTKRQINFIVDFGIVYLVYYTLFSLMVAHNNIGYSYKLSVSTLGIVFFTYYYTLELAFQQTLGKMLSKTKVVTLEGKAPGFIRLFIRTIVRLTPFDFISYAFGVGKGQHDYFSKTIVVNAMPKNQPLKK